MQSSERAQGFIRIGALAVLQLVSAAVLASCQSVRAPAIPTPSPAVTSGPISMAPTREWILVDLPPDASQLQYGGEVYRLVCSACHGDHGQGLTADWLATWAPADRNCWQSHCHGPNHPPDGFELPVAPAISGSGALAAFVNAQRLHDYIQSSMPWQNPNSLTEKDSWGTTAFVLKLNGIDPGANLGPQTATRIQISP